MATTEITVRMTRSEARRLIASAPAILAGRVPDPTGHARALRLRDVAGGG